MFNILLVGAGDRGMIYAKQSLVTPDIFKIVGVVEPSDTRRNAAGELFGIPEDKRFRSVKEATDAPKFADAIFNCTMDAMHADTTIPFLDKGYHALLEKPIANNISDVDRIYRAALKNKSTVMICHVLRYAPFYKRIKEAIVSGEIGEIKNIQMADQVSYFHASVSYVRGKYGDPDICGSGMLLSKCSHDIDLMAWLMGGNRAKNVFSSGSTMQFRKENAPEGAADRCLPDCIYKDSCEYSAKKLYIDYPQRWANRVWNDCDLVGADDEKKTASLEDVNNQYGRCVYKSNMKIVDHQSVLVEFENGATGTFSMTAGSAVSGRTIHVIGTKGEIEGAFQDEKFVIRKIAPQLQGGFEEKVVDLSNVQKKDAHGCGDKLLLGDFWALLGGKTPSVCCTSLEDSLLGHEILFRAEDFREKYGK